jgi:hypothetical protein
MRSPSLRLLVLLTALAAALATAGTARANGDPASDYLITQLVFLPFESETTDANENSLRELLASSKDKGYEVRVALIGTPRDLGAIPSLYRQPQRYADFLGQELVYYWKGPTLIVMPNGFGIFQPGKALKEEKQVLAKLTAPGSTDANVLAQSAETAVRALAQRRGITLPAAQAEQTGSSKNRDRVILVAGVILLCVAAFGARMLLARRSRDAEAA